MAPAVQVHAPAAFHASAGSPRKTLPGYIMESAGPDVAWLICNRAHNGDLDGLQALQQTGCNLTVGDYDQRTALHLAAAAGHLHVIKYLVEEAGCKLQRDRFGGLPTHDAERYGHDAVKEYLQSLEYEEESVHWKLAGSSEWRAALMSKVLSLVMKEGVFLFTLAYTEVQYYFTSLGLDDWYFQHYTPAQVSKHILAYIASKKVAQTSGKYIIQFHMESEHTAFYLTTVGSDNEPFHHSEHLIGQWLENVTEGYAFSVTFLVSRGAAFKGKKDQLAIYVVEKYPYQQAEVSEEEDSIELVATTTFLKEKHPQLQVQYQQLIQKVIRSSTGSYAGVLPLEQVQGVQYPSGWGDWLVQFGIRQRQPMYLEQFSQVFQSFGIEPRKKHIETFQNGVTAYHFYCSDLPIQQLDDCLRALQLVPHMKSSPITHLFLENAICSDGLIYLFCAARFAFHFVKKETLEYQVLVQALANDPANKQKLDQLYLQAMMDLLTESRICETILKYVDFARNCYSDFKEIALGNRAPFLNEELAGQLALIRNDTDAKVLQAMLTFNEHLQMTNFFRQGGTPSSVAFRLNPKFLAEVSPTIFPEAPHTVYLVVGRAFYGFHVRFRDVARGGIRLIKSRDATTYRRNAGTLFEENYNLAFTQQRKNKDIPEGGSKGTILLNADAQHTADQSFKQYIDALLDCMMPEANGIYCPGTPDILYFGPDENTAHLMATGAFHAQKRGYPLWKALTTGKPPALGGIPHDVYGMTTRSVHTFKLELLAALNLKEEDMTKVQTGGPDGDLGSNEIKISKDKTIAIVDGSGVAYDPKGLNRDELLSLAERRVPICNFTPALLSEGGFLVPVEATNVTLPDGTLVQRGDTFRDGFHLSAYATADLFVPCGGRPKSVHGENVACMFTNGQPKFKYIVEGANLFFTDNARKVLEAAGVPVLKDASTNKGGVTSSSLEVLAALVMPAEDHDALMCPQPGEVIPEFYSKYVEHIQTIISNKASMEFRCLWEERQRNPDNFYTTTTEKLSTKINGMCDMIALEMQDVGSMDDEVIRTVLGNCIPTLLLDRYGTDHIMSVLPLNYIHAAVASWLAATYVYQCGFAANEYAFHKFLNKILAPGRRSSAV